MKKIVHEEPVEFFNFKNLTGKEIVAYRCKSSDNVAILANVSSPNLPEKYGFIAIGDTTSYPRFTGSSFYDAVCLCMKQREVLVFENTIELAKFIWKK